MRSIYFVLILAACSCSSAARQSSSSPPSHQIWDALLHEHVDDQGMVDYPGFIEDSVSLNQYLTLLSNNTPDKETWDINERKAYWINAYNAFTVKLIVDNYPVKSIRDLGPAISIPTINTVWHKKFFRIGGRESSLDEIEHDILREEFGDSRIHFAINCASQSCPKLRNEAYVSGQLEQQLEEQARSFINDSSRNKIDGDDVYLSKIFKWFENDFTKNGDIINYLNQYVDTPILKNADMDYLPYDWALNEK